MKNKYFSKKWEQFKKELPHQSGEMVKRNWGHN